ncbi:hypothetical protein [Variovorax sp. WS11]|nr:hypothetical protein [Variovorax sp. WS11]
MLTTTLILAHAATAALLLAAAFVRAREVMAVRRKQTPAHL